MPVISFLKAKPPLDVEVGANLMAALQSAGVVVASSCRGDGICRKCRMTIVMGEKNLSAPEALELQWQQYDGSDRKTRLSCQARVFGDITVDAAYW